MIKAKAPGGFEFEVSHEAVDFAEERKAFEAWLAHVAERLKENPVTNFPPVMIPSVWAKRPASTDDVQAWNNFTPEEQAIVEEQQRVDAIEEDE